VILSAGYAHQLVVLDYGELDMLTDLFGEVAKYREEEIGELQRPKKAVGEEEEFEIQTIVRARFLLADVTRCHEASKQAEDERAMQPESLR
jgi:hypothetical protein